MALQFIHDIRGNTTGVFIPIEDWQTLKTKYSDLQIEEIENIGELATWQKNIINERMSDYYKNTTEIVDFDKTIDDIENSL